MIEDPDRTLISALYQNLEHASFMLPFSEGEDLWLGSRVHAVKVEAVEEGLHEIEVILPFLDPVVSVVPIVDDPDVRVSFGPQSLADHHQVFRFPAPTTMVVEA